MMMMMSYIMKADADDESMTPSRNDRRYTLRSVQSSSGQSFLDTQVSLAPTHVSWLVGWLVSWLVTLSDFQSLVSNGRSNQKVQKTKSIYFRILLLEGPSPPTKMYMKA